MSQKSNVIKLNEKRQNPVNEDTLLIINLGQILLEVVRQHGAHVTLQAVQGMIQDAQKTVRQEKNLPASKRNKVVSNG